MAQKLFEPFKKIPQQIQNLNIVQKIHDLTTGRTSEFFGSNTDFNGGCVKSPSAVAFDGYLGLLAVGTESGSIKVYGSPGRIFPVQSSGAAVVALAFIPHEVRLLSAFSDGRVALFDFMPTDCSWKKSCTVALPFIEKEAITSMTVGRGVIYVGSSTGTLRQIAVKDGRLSLADDALTACTRAMLSSSLTSGKCEQLDSDSPIVSLEMQPNGDSLLIAYADGCVAVAVPQPFPESQPKTDIQPATSTSTEAVAVAPTAEAETAVAIAGSEAEPTATASPAPTEHEQPVEETGAGAAAQSGEVEAGKSLPATPVKGHSEKRATLKLRTLTRNWRTTAEKIAEAESSAPPLPVPPSPRISHLLLRDQAVEYATWRQLSNVTQPDEVVVAYADGAFQVWPVCSAVDTIDGQQSVMEPLIVSKKDPPNMPYGPLPCGAIKKMIVCPSAAGGVLTAFSGGLPRPEFEERYAVSVLLDQEHHVCFQFGSPVIDFLFIPARKEPTVPESPVDPVKPFDAEPAVALLVLTERELVAIDLMQPNWPTVPAPYLTCLDASPVTALAHVNKVPAPLLSVNKASWPIWGGLCASTEAGKEAAVGDMSEATTATDLVLLGHSDGSISLLALEPGDCTYLAGRIHTHTFFQPLDEKVGPEEESWPPFRRVGMSVLPPGAASFTDPRLSIVQLLAVVDHQPSADSHQVRLTIVAGGSAGQVTVWSTANPQTVFEPDISRVSANLLDSDSNAGKYTWAGGSPLKPFEGPIQSTASSPVPCALHLSPCALIQLEPATAVTALAWEASWHLAAVGTAYGFALVDMLARRPVHVELLLVNSSRLATTTSGNTPLATVAAKTVNSVTTMQTAIVQRGKQLSVNMRQSFRRLKHLRTSTSAAESVEKVEEVVEGEATEGVQPNPIKEEEETAAPVEEVGTESVNASAGDEKSVEKPDTPVVEEKTETTVVEEEEVVVALPEPVIVLTDSSAANECHNVVRSLLLTDTFVVTPAAGAGAAQRTPSLWVGTSSGRVLAHSLDWPDSAGPVTLHLVKELQLQHQAPVIAVAAIHQASRAPVGPGERARHSHEPVPEVPPCQSSPAPETTGEEQAVKEESPAAPEKATPTTPAVVELHQLVVCSTEQVKLFALPSLRALHKHKVVVPTAEQRLRLAHLLHSTSLGKSTSSEASPAGQATVTAAPGDAEVAAAVPAEGTAGEGEKEENTEAVAQQLSAHEANPKAGSSAVPTANRQLHRKSLTCFALQQFTKTGGASEWVVVAARRDGKVVILSLPTLRRQFKATSACAAGADLSHVAQAGDNIALWWSGTAVAGAPLVGLDLSSSPRLTPKAVIGGREACLPVPDWARPRKLSSATKATAKTEEANTTVAGGDGAQEVPLIDTAHQAGTTHEASPPLPEASDAEVVNQSATGIACTVGEAPQSGESVIAVGDVTMDTIKEYLNGDDKGEVTVKTIETSTEKHTLVEAGRVVTTLHETETVDGKVVKDDLVKITSDDPGGDTVVLQTVAGSP